MFIYGVFLESPDTEAQDPHHPATAKTYQDNKSNQTNLSIGRWIAF